MSDTEKPANEGHGSSAADRGAHGAAAQGASAHGVESLKPDTAQTRPEAANEAATADARNAELEVQIADLTDRLLRAHADMDNLRKRTEREKQDGMKYAISKFALDICGISDNFQRAVASVPPGADQQDGTLKSLVEGVLMTERAFIQVLERHGVRRIDPMGEPFNPNLHQAVMEQENPAVPAGSVMQVFQPGFMIEDRVLRPAMVVVARGGAKVTRPAEAHRPPPSNGARNGNGSEDQGNGNAA